MNTIKKYIDCHVPITACNFRCEYCYVTQQGKFKNLPVKLEYSPKHVRNALSKKRVGGVAFLNLCGGGETLLCPDIEIYIEELLEEGHFVSIVTNGTISRIFDKILNIKNELLKRLFFKFSFHYLELKRLNKFDVFFDNIHKIDKAGCSFSVEITPYDKLIPHIKDIQKISMLELGALPHITVARNNCVTSLPILTSLSKEEYYKIWNDAFDSELFRYKFSMFGVKQTKFCYAGSWSFSLNLGNGNLNTCHFGGYLSNIFKDIVSPFPNKPIGEKCPQAHCYNAHGWIAWGDVPKLYAPTYYDLRQRITKNGSFWVKQPVKSFFKTKLYKSNKKDIIENYITSNYYHIKNKIKLNITKNINDILASVNKKIKSLVNEKNTHNR